MVACANQTAVIPQLHVEPNAAARIMYFDKRAHALIAERQPQAAAVPDDCPADDPPAPRTWGAPEETKEAQAGDADPPPCGSAKN